MLRQIKKLMNADGCLFLDYANPFTIENAGIDEEPIIENTFLDPSTGASIIQKSQSRLDYAQQCLHTTWIFEMKDAISGKADRLDVEVDYWYLFPHQLQLVLQGAGFRLQHMMGGYDHAPFSEESERLLLLAVPAN